MALVALEEETIAGGSPVLRAAALRKLGLEGRTAALIASPRTKVLDVNQKVETEHGLPSRTLGGEWAKTPPEARKS